MLRYLAVAVVAIAIDARGHGQSDKPHDPLKYGPRMTADVIESGVCKDAGRVYFGPQLMAGPS
jgi:hypothetical protein